MPVVLGNLFSGTEFNVAINSSGKLCMAMLFYVAFIATASAMKHPHRNFSTHLSLQCFNDLSASFSEFLASFFKNKKLVLFQMWKMFLQNEKA